jgi:hypothetical protein
LVKISGSQRLFGFVRGTEIIPESIPKWGDERSVYMDQYGEITIKQAGSPRLYSWVVDRLHQYNLMPVI